MCLRQLGWRQEQERLGLELRQKELELKKAREDLDRSKATGDWSIIRLCLSYVLGWRDWRWIYKYIYRYYYILYIYVCVYCTCIYIYTDMNPYMYILWILGNLRKEKSWNVTFQSIVKFHLEIPAVWVYPKRFVWKREIPLKSID
jgi:hypothetical protein